MLFRIIVVVNLAFAGNRTFTFLYKGCLDECNCWIRHTRTNDVKDKVQVYSYWQALFACYTCGEKELILLQKMEHNQEKLILIVTEHVRSMSNISTDESNLERINRWNSALRMFREKPVFGHGPGTYMFKYAPYQRLKDKTAISTDFGDLGNAHSEYIGPLAESGFFGGLSIVIVGIVSLITGFRVYNRLTDKRLKGISTGNDPGIDHLPGPWQYE